MFCSKADKGWFNAVINALTSSYAVINIGSALLDCRRFNYLVGCLDIRVMKASSLSFV